MVVDKGNPRPALVKLIDSASLSLSIAAQIAEGDYSVDNKGLEEVNEAMRNLGTMVSHFTDTLVNR